MAQPNPFAALTYDAATGGIIPTPTKPMAPSDPFGLGLDRPAGPVVIGAPAVAQPRQVDETDFAIGARIAQTGALARDFPRQDLQPQPAPRPAVPAGVAAWNVAASRDAGLPSDLVPKYGTMFGADYDARVDQAAAEGRITPQQAEAAKKRRADFYNTPFGQQIAGVEAKSQYEQDVAQLKLQQMETEEGLSERALAAKVENDERIREEEEAFKLSREAMEAEMVGRRKEMDALRADIAATKIDPQNYFASQSNLAKVLSVISVGIGGFASGYSGGKIPNTALAQLNAAIDRDIEAQKSNLSTKRGALAEAQSVYAMARQKLGDDQQAFAYSRALLLDQAKRYAEQLGAEGRTQQIQNMGKQFARTIAFDADQAQRQVLQYHLQRKVAEDALRAQQAFAASPAGRAAAAASAEARDRKERIRELKQVVEERKLEAEFAKAGREISGELDSKGRQDMAASYVGAAGGYVPAGADDAKKLREGLSSIDVLNAYVDRAKSIIEENPVMSRLPGTDASNALSATRSLIDSTLSVAQGQGALGKEEAQNLRSDISTSFAAGTTGLESLKANMQKKKETLIRDYDVIPAERTVTPTGVSIRLKPEGAAVAAPVIKRGW